MKKIFALTWLTCLLAACGSTQTPASTAVENYLQALSNKDETQMLSQICADYEFDALLEFDALAQVQTELKGVSCRQVDMDGDTASVTCSGSIVSSYGSELLNYDLSGRTYSVTKNGEDWLVCGYTK